MSQTRYFPLLSPLFILSFLRRYYYQLKTNTPVFFLMFIRAVVTTSSTACICSLFQFEFMASWLLNSTVPNEISAYNATDINLSRRIQLLKHRLYCDS